jgi:hypothetical protein
LIRDHLFTLRERESEALQVLPWLRCQAGSGGACGGTRPPR